MQRQEQSYKAVEIRKGNDIYESRPGVTKIVTLEAYPTAMVPESLLCLMARSNQSWWRIGFPNCGLEEARNSDAYIYAHAQEERRKVNRTHTGWE